MIRELVLPYYYQIARAFGGKLLIHFCSTPKLMGRQILDAFLEDQSVIGISTQEGLRFYASEWERLQGKLAIETGYGTGLLSICESYSRFPGWVSDFRRKFKELSGLIIYTTVFSIDEGRHLYKTWCDGA